MVSNCLLIGNAEHGTNGHLLFRAGEEVLKPEILSLLFATISTRNTMKLVIWILSIGWGRLPLLYLKPGQKLRRISICP
jgi:hypothetical protein